jgi:uncharacterized protein (TIGR03086 family)
VDDTTAREEAGDMELTSLHRRTVENWQRILDNVTDDQWDDPTPCTEWNVRALVNHVVVEQLWTRPLLEGSTIDEVGDRFDGDVLGDDPITRGRETSADAAGAADSHVPEGGIVHVSYGDIPAGEYVRQLSADHLIHGWDLAAATGQSRDLDPELVGDVAEWFAGQEEAYRSAGAVGPRPESGGEPASDLLAGFGRDAGWETPAE